MDLGLQGKVAAVTGASRGIGKAIVEALVREGMRLVLVARDEERLRAVADALPEPADLPLVVAVDLLHDDAPAHVVAAASERFGGVDVLVHCAGVSLGGAIDQTTVEDFRRSFRMNVEVPFLLARASIPGMRERGFGRVIMMSSIFGREAGGKIPYNASKAAETSLAKALAREVAGDGITVNTVAPGSILYPGGSWANRIEADPEGMADWVKRELPRARFGTVEEVAAVVVFLCSSQASLVTGASIAVDGGQGRSNL